MVTAIIWRLWTVTTGYYNGLTNSHTLQITTTQTKSSQFSFNSRCWVTALNNVVSSASVFTPLPSVSQLTHCPNCRLSTNFKIKMKVMLRWTVNPDQSRKLLLALASTVALGIGPRRDRWSYLSSFHTFTCFEMGPHLLREEGSDYYRSLPSTLE
jgi:hypothetical protein